MELPDSFRAYNVQGKIGGGAHSTLFMASLPSINELTGDSNVSVARSNNSAATKQNQRSKDHHFAIKCISLAASNLKIEDIVKETKAMVQMKHPNVIQYHKAFFDNACLFIVMELCSASIYDILRFRYSSMSGTKAVPVMKAKEVASVNKQILDGLLYIHKDGIIHRDIKSANMLYNEQGLIKIADFGVSGILNVSIASREARTSFVGTPSYISPEVIMGHEYDQRADIWSFGIMSIEMASGIAPYSDLKPIKIISEILKKDPPTLENCSISKDQFKKYPKSFNKFIKFCLQKDPSNRKLCDELLTSEFISNFAKDPSYIVRSILLNNTLNILEHKLESKEYKRSYNFELSDEEEDIVEKTIDDSNNLNVSKKLTKSNSSIYSSAGTNEQNRPPKLSPVNSYHDHGGSKPLKKDHQPNQICHLILNLRNLDDNELQTVEFDVGVNDNWNKWASDMHDKNLIIKDHIESMANALRLVMENDFAALTFKLDKNADSTTLDKENLIGYVQLKVVKKS